MVIHEKRVKGLQTFQDFRETRPWIGSKQFHVNRSRYGPVWFETVPVQSRVNLAFSRRQRFVAFWNGDVVVPSVQIFS